MNPTSVSPKSRKYLKRTTRDFVTLDPRKEELRRNPRSVKHKFNDDSLTSLKYLDSEPKGQKNQRSHISNSESDQRDEIDEEDEEEDEDEDEDEDEAEA